MAERQPERAVCLDAGYAGNDALNLIVEIKGYRGQDAKGKKATRENYWVPGVNNLGNYGRCAFAEFTDVYEIQADFKEKVEAEFTQMIESFSVQPAA